METVKFERQEVIDALVERDGAICAMPFCGKPIDFSIKSGPNEPTIEHWIPQWFGKENGWTWEQINDLSNLKLAHKKCNAKKGERLPNEDGTLPERKEKTFRYRRQKRAERPEVCTSCNAGRNLGPDEVCASCNSGPQPERFPRWAKVKATECDHQLFWCAWCSIGIIQREPAVDTAVLQSESGEWE